MGRAGNSNANSIERRYVHLRDVPIKNIFQTGSGCVFVTLERFLSQRGSGAQRKSGICTTDICNNMDAPTRHYTSSHFGFAIAAFFSFDRKKTIFFPFVKLLVTIKSRIERLFCHNSFWKHVKIHSQNDCTFEEKTKIITCEGQKKHMFVLLMFLQFHWRSVIFALSRLSAKRMADG